MYTGRGDIGSEISQVLALVRRAVERTKQEREMRVWIGGGSEIVILPTKLYSAVVELPWVAPSHHLSIQFQLPVFLKYDQLYLSRSAGCISHRPILIFL